MPRLGVRERPHQNLPGSPSDRLGRLIHNPAPVGRQLAVPLRARAVDDRLQLRGGTEIEQPQVNARRHYVPLHEEGPSIRRNRERKQPIGLGQPEEDLRGC